MRKVAVRLFHLRKMNIRDLQLGFSGLGHVRKEGLEIGVFLLRLRQAGSASNGIHGGTEFVNMLRLDDSYTSG